MKSPGVPKQITQKPFDFDPGHYRRLCLLEGAEPDVADLYDYALDLQYTEIQPDLLRHLLPILLQAWRRDLFEGSKAGYGGFVEQFWGSLVLGSAFKKVLSKAESDAIGAYFRNSILDRLDMEDSLRFPGKGAFPSGWVQALVCYGTLFSDVEILWNEWWEMKSSGHAVAAFQYVSALMYEEKKNPVFDAWIPEKGGGPPTLWECGAMMFDVGWKQENLAFFKTTLSVDYFEGKLRLALDQVKNAAAKKVASGILDDFPGQRARLELRIEELPELLTDVSRTDGFTI
jgi:hypothetical protein